MDVLGSKAVLMATEGNLVLWLPLDSPTGDSSSGGHADWWFGEPLPLTDRERGHGAGIPGLNEVASWDGYGECADMPWAPAPFRRKHRHIQLMWQTTGLEMAMG